LGERAARGRAAHRGSAAESFARPYHARVLIGRDLARYLDLAACDGEARERAEALAPDDYSGLVGWYLAAKPRP